MIRFSLLFVVATAVGWSQTMDYRTQLKNRPMLSALDSPYNLVPDNSGYDNTSKLVTLMSTTNSIVFFPAGNYNCALALLSGQITVKAAAVYAVGVTFTNCKFIGDNPSGSLTWIGSTQVNTGVYSGTADSPLLLIKRDDTTVINAKYTYTRNYTAIQIGTTGFCPSHVSLIGINTTSNGQSHITKTCGTDTTVNGWVLNGTGGETGFANEALTADNSRTTLVNVTAVNSNNILQIAGAVHNISDTLLANCTATNVSFLLYLEGNLGGTGDINNTRINGCTVTDLNGTAFNNFANVFTNGSNINGMAFSNNTINARYNSGVVLAMPFVFAGSNGAVFNDVSITGNTINSPSSGGGVLPATILLASNNANWNRFSYTNNVSSPSRGPAIDTSGAQFTTQADLNVSNNTFAGCSVTSITPCQHIQGRIFYTGNNTTLYSGQTEIQSDNNAADPAGVTYAELTTIYAHSVPGTVLWCDNCTVGKPPSNSGSGANCTKESSDWSCVSAIVAGYGISLTGSTIRTTNIVEVTGAENGSNNAIACSNGVLGCGSIPLAPGLIVCIAISHSLRAGANTFNYAGTTQNIKSGFNYGNDIGTAYIASTNPCFMNVGGAFLDMRQ